MKSTLLLVGMNRLPFEIRAIKTQEGEFTIECKDSPGGLASALEPLKKTHNAIYIGWIGKNDVPDDEKAAIEKYCQEYKIIPVFLTEEECKLYYGDFANRELWPIFHDLMQMRSPDSLDNKKKAWEMYKAVNKKFASAYVNYILQQEIKSPHIWLHDYHLLTCAQEIVNQLLVKGFSRSDINIGFFSHIPSPLPENFLKLNDIDPAIATTLLSGLLSNDYCGFQTHENARRIAETARQLGFTVVESNSQYKISTGAHQCIVGANPISIDPTSWISNSNASLYDDYIAQYFARTSALLNQYSTTSPLETAETKKLFLSKIEAIHTELIHAGPNAAMPESTVFDGSRKLIISVQRADYTKGMPEQLDAYEQFLNDHPEQVKKVSFIFVAVPSRSGLDEFDQTFKIVVDKILAMRAKYGDDIIQFSSGFDKLRLARLYRKADVIWVNSLADGMNLVAKEAVICQTEQSPGQLLIGKGAGAAEALVLEGQGAYVINDPKNIQATSELLHTALSTPAQEAVQRVTNMQAQIKANTIEEYALGFIADQNKAHRLGTATALPVSATLLSSCFTRRGAAPAVLENNANSRRDCVIL
jgi:trehalose 6-phosphate synthase/phosphatase